ncbi:MAG: carboxypeptidase regulatory-like domain-containing protein [Acidobacteria bacterium]|nr:carboxypeptidase regulatory-like domain-containing protein [Acidobacteriota bacterium]
MAVAFSCVAVAAVVTAQTQSPPALTGTVTSHAEGAMEGVLVGARKTGSTIATWVVTNAQGEYRFLRERLEPGTYTIRIRAVGYKTAPASVDVTPHGARLDLPLEKVTRATELGMQLSNTEWLASVPGTPGQKLALSGCVNCHTLQRVLFSRFNAEEMAQVVQRMRRHTNNSSLLHPWMRPADDFPHGPPTAAQIDFGKYLSTINLSGRDTFEFPLKTLPRPTGKATEVMYTVYELPRPDASPHDTVFDSQGNLWYSDFNSQFIGKLDLKTGKVVDYVVPQSRGLQTAQGGLQIDVDRDGKLYFGNMFQMALVRFDPKTETFEAHKLPMPESAYGDGHLTMIDPAFQHLDGKLWVNVAYDTGTAGGTWQVDLASNKWTQVKYPPGSPSARAYDVVANSKNDMYGIGLTVDKIWVTNGKTLETVWYDLPTKGPGCRRGHVDAKDRLWCGVFQGNRVAMFDPQTKKITEWKVPTEWTRPYDAEFDDRGSLWTAGMDGDLAVRLNVETGEFTEYLLPHRTNVRSVRVQKSGGVSSLWLGDQHGNTITRIEPLAP